MDMLKTDFISLPKNSLDYKKYATIQMGKYEVTVAEYALYQREQQASEGEGTSNSDNQMNKSEVVDLSKKTSYKRTKKSGVDWRHDAVGREISRMNISRHPVVNVTWEEANGFCEWLNSQDLNYTYRLPTRKEWIYFAQGGANEYQYPWGNELGENRYAANFRDTSIFLSMDIMGKGKNAQIEPHNDADLTSKKIAGLPHNIRNSGIGFRIVKESKSVEDIREVIDKGN